MIEQNRKYSLRRQNGLTMIELMIAMLVGLLLMGGVVQLFVSTKQSYNIQEAQARVQENGRLAMNFLPYDIRLADFQGCRSRQQYSTTIIAVPTVDCPNNKDCPPSLDTSLFELKSGITGENDIQYGTADATEGTQTVVVGTDKLGIQFAGSCGGYIVGNYDTSNANIQIDGKNTCNVKKYWPYLISDCARSHVFRAESLNKNATKETIALPQSVNLANQLANIYKSDAELFSIRSLTYFVSKNPSGHNSLYRRDHVTGINEEIVEGVEDMQILYGDDTDGDNTANYYVDASNFPVDAGTGKRKMQNVKSLKISLLLRSLSDVNVTSQPIPYAYNGAKLTAGDRQLRKVFTTTVTLRNRLP
ncbi:MAG: PilW family protein [Methylococcales bacterium]